MCHSPIKTVVLSIIPMILLVSPARAEAILRVTEVWPGGFAGAEATSDWLEVTNLGDTSAENIDGNLYFDDLSNNPTLSDPLRGIDTIPPGDSVIYLTSWEDDFNAVVEDAVAEFRDMWGPLPVVQIGYVPFGSGFGGSDAAVIFDGNTAEATTIDFVAFDAVGSVASFVAEADGAWTPRLAHIGVLGAYAGNLPAHDLAPEPPIGSPGTVVPEPRSPSAFAISAGLSLLLLGRKKRRDPGTLSLWASKTVHPS